MGHAIRDRVLEMGFCTLFQAVGGGGLNDLEFALLERDSATQVVALTHFFGRPQGILMACEGEQMSAIGAGGARRDGRAGDDRADAGPMFAA